jgi:predicted  nucleic acid-binding Zn-ribbon protein
MQSELKITEDALVPLYDKLAEIDEQMKDQKGKIQNMKTQIIKNQSTIKSLLYSVVTTKS